MKRTAILLVIFLFVQSLVLLNVSAITMFGINDAVYDYDGKMEVTTWWDDGGINVWVEGWPNTMTYLRAFDIDNLLVEEHSGKSNADSVFETDFTKLKPGLMYDFEFEIEGLNDGRPVRFTSLEFEDDYYDDEIDAGGTTEVGQGEPSTAIEDNTFDFWYDIPLALRLTICGVGVIPLAVIIYKILNRKRKSR